jgi:serine O-acetyltransferase
MFENIREDYCNYNKKLGAQGLWVMTVYRFGRWRYGLKNSIGRKLGSAIYRIMYKLVQIITGIELPCEVEIGRNFLIEHFGGIVISGYTKIGDNCRIRNGVVIGLKNTKNPCAPVIRNNVDIGSGAKLLGAIKIGDNVCIGANAVVITDVPANSIAVGVPAVVKAIKSEG